MKRDFFCLGLVMVVLPLALVTAAGGCSRSRKAAKMDPVQAVQVTPVTGEALTKLIRQAQASVVVVNVWATWCAPCVEEFPQLVRFQKHYRDVGVKFFFVSADIKSNLPAVREFLARQKAQGPAYLKTGPDDEFVRALSMSWSGAIPAVFVFDSKGILRHFHEGKVGDNQLSDTILDVLKGPVSS